MDPAAEFDSALTEAARQMVATLGKSHGSVTAKELAARAHQVVFRALSDDFENEPMTPSQAEFLKSLCDRFEDVEFDPNLTRRQAQPLIADLKEQLDSRKPAWARR
jgi:hypothetical protein